MSETLTQINAVEELIGWGGMLTHMLVKDISACTEETFQKTYGGKSRSAASVTGELVAMHDYVTKALNGEITEMKGVPSASKEAGIADIQRAFGDLVAAIKANESSLSEMTMAPWQQEITKYQLAQVTINHTWYHDGQINTMQLIEGDDAVHWME